MNRPRHWFRQERRRLTRELPDASLGPLFGEGSAFVAFRLDTFVTT